MTPTTAVVAVGSNVGDRQSYLDRAVGAVDALPGARVLSTSRVYQSAGWGREGLKPFLNAAFSVEINSSPHDFLHDLQRIEDQLGRQRTLKWGPRTLDLDLLVVDEECTQTSELVLPHPWIAHRPFVYLPFRELPGLSTFWKSLSEPTVEGLSIEKDTVPLGRQPPLWGNLQVPEKMEEVQTSSEKMTEEIGRALGRVLQGGEIIALNAPMGTGKSVIARGIARGLGIEGPIQSPSYTLCRRYESGRLNFEHWDFYRLGSPDDLESTGYFDPLAENTVRVIEWASRFPEAVENPYLRVDLKIVSADSRIVTFNPSDALPFSARIALAGHGKTMVASGS